MRILLFFLWLTLGLAYFLIWNQRQHCCETGVIQDSTSLNLFTPASPASTSIPILPKEPIDTKSITTIAKGIDLAVDENAIDSIPGCIHFKWGQSDPLTRPCFNSWRDSLIASLQEGQVIEIIGEYFDRENQVMASGDLGLIRAMKTKKLFQQTIEEARLKIRSKSVPEKDAVEFKPFASLDVHTLFYNELIKELDDKTLIYFAYGVEDQIHNQWLETFADHLVKKYKKSKQEFMLVGHTDDDATAVSNLKLGLQRAELIKYLLVSKGLNASRIKTSSKGESSPIAPNDTEQNRSLNRRVELFIITPNQSK